MTRSKRPTYEDLQNERIAFIGPPAPPQPPKIMPAAEREAVRARLLNEMSERIAAETDAERG